MHTYTNSKELHKMTASEGVVVKYNKQKATFRIRYQGFERKMDVEDVDMATLKDILNLGRRQFIGASKTPRKGGDSGECRQGD